MVTAAGYNFYLFYLVLRDDPLVPGLLKGELQCVCAIVVVYGPKRTQRGVMSLVTRYIKRWFYVATLAQHSANVSC